ncbi:TetR/AcrR family transcriptional regulator, partial [Streptomyces scabiei]|uniref:TetR/AcrR family transcriptional regulator n=1 Tax=Streptomyces scabiei TaxID=1930 RepID=UPI00211B2EDB
MNDNPSPEPGADKPDAGAVGPRDGAEQPGPKGSAKSEQTRALILETALRLFQERGYDKTTMRAIAQEAGVSVGNAYYYFAGKEHLIQGFYDRIGGVLEELRRELVVRLRHVQPGLQHPGDPRLQVLLPLQHRPYRRHVLRADPVVEP